jgi:TolB-like protein
VRNLTPRQLEVLELVAKGLTNKEIANVLGIAFGTVRNHASAVMESLGVANRTEAALALQKLGLGSEAAAGPEEDPAFQVPGFGGRPAIAVLPFEGLSPGPEDDYLADGIADDLITRLSQWRWFPVIARNSTFAYRDRRDHVADVATVSRELGARYVIRGSVRCRGARIRVNVQLIDGPTGHQVWAERYDREKGDLFALQDEIVLTIVGALEPAITRLEQIRSVQRDPGTLDAWACLQRGTHHVHQGTRDGIRAGLSWLRQAQELDPEFAPAWGTMAMTHGLALFRQLADSPAEAVAEFVRCAERAMRCDPEDPMANVASGMARFVQGQRQAAVESFERAAELMPSYSLAQLALCIALRFDDDRIEDAIRAGRTALRLSPHDPLAYLTYGVLSSAVLMTRRFEEALELAQRSLQRNAEFLHAHLAIAGCAGQLGRQAEARASIDALLAHDFDFSLAHHAVFQPPAVLVLCLEGWAKAGFVPFSDGEVPVA